MKEAKKALVGWERNLNRELEEEAIVQHNTREMLGAHTPLCPPFGFGLVINSILRGRGGEEGRGGGRRKGKERKEGIGREGEEGKERRNRMERKGRKEGMEWKGKEGKQ